MAYTNPYADRNKAQSTWNKFMDSLSWEKLEKKGELKTVKGVRSMFLGAGIPMKKRKDD